MQAYRLHLKCCIPLAGARKHLSNMGTLPGWLRPTFRLRQCWGFGISGYSFGKILITGRWYRLLSRWAPCSALAVNRDIFS